MSKKITWKKVYNDFKARHPNLYKSVDYWRPNNLAIIELYFKDGRRGTYDYDTKLVKFTKRVE